MLQYKKDKKLKPNPEVLELKRKLDNAEIDGHAFLIALNSFQRHANKTRIMTIDFPITRNVIKYLRLRLERTTENRLKGAIENFISLKEKGENKISFPRISSYALDLDWVIKEHEFYLFCLQYPALEQSLKSNRFILEKRGEEE